MWRLERVERFGRRHVEVHAYLRLPPAHPSLRYFRGTVPCRMAGSLWLQRFRVEDLGLHAYLRPPPALECRVKCRMSVREPDSLSRASVLST